MVVSSKMETNIKGIYAAGDMATYPGKVKLIAAGLEKHQQPSIMQNPILIQMPRIQPLHSTSIMGERKKEK